MGGLRLVLVYCLPHHLLGLFESLFPDLYAYYEKTMLSIQIRDGLMLRHARRSVFASTSLNVGTNMATEWHCDAMNLLLGLCPIVATGSFDHERSGHLWLNECRTIAEVGPGDVVFILSSLLGHKNSAILAGEERQSIVFHTSFLLFQWVRNGHKPAKGVVREDDEDATSSPGDSDLVAEGLKRLGYVERFIEGAGEK